MIDQELRAQSAGAQAQVACTQVVHSGTERVYRQATARCADADAAGAQHIALQRLQHIEYAARHRLCNHQITAAAVFRAGIVKLGCKQINPGGRADGQVSALQRLAALAVRSVVQLLDRAAGRVQAHVIPGTAVIGLQFVAYGDVVDRIELDSAVDLRDHGGYRVVLHRDGAAVDLSTIAQRWLAEAVVGAYAHRAAASGRMTAHISPAEYQLAKALLKRQKLGVGDVQRIAIAVRGIAYLQRYTRAALAQRQRPGPADRRFAAGKINLVAFNEYGACA